MSNKLKCACILTAAILAFGAGASSAEYLLETHLSGDQCVPATSSTAAGVANLIVDAAYTQAGYTLNFAGLDTEQTGAAFVRALPGGEITEVLLELPLGSPISGVWILSPEAIEAMKEDGTLEALNVKYFGPSFTLTYEDLPE